MNKIPFYKHFKHINNLRYNINDKKTIYSILDRIDLHMSIIQFEINKINDIKMELIRNNNVKKTYNAYQCDDNYDYDDYYTQKVIKQGGL
tara:strand:- start:194 stop:463 length:270 start_codon:yes stop_codon:yes gene_type:complete